MGKVVMILVDGMRPDAVMSCGHPFVNELLAHSYHDLKAQTVMPSVTLPCHMSLFHSVTPDRHGILTNTYVPQVRPIRGLCEVLKAAGKDCTIFFNWEELKDLSRPDSLAYSNFMSGHRYTWEKTNAVLTDNCVRYIQEEQPDFTFLYLGWVDEAGHADGWLGEEYMRATKQSFDCIEKVVRSIPKDYTVIVLADHGGHDRHHGSDMPEDMTIPVFVYNEQYTNTELQGVNIIDVAPTIAQIEGVPADHDWEGKALPIA